MSDYFLVINKKTILTGGNIQSCVLFLAPLSEQGSCDFS
jgi:hypothetical protein